MSVSVCPTNKVFYSPDILASMLRTSYNYPVLSCEPCRCCLLHWSHCAANGSSSLVMKQSFGSCPARTKIWSRPTLHNQCLIPHHHQEGRNFGFNCFNISVFLLVLTGRYNTKHMFYRDLIQDLQILIRFSMFERIFCILFDTSIKILSYLWRIKGSPSSNTITLEKIFVQPNLRLSSYTKAYSD